MSELPKLQIAYHEAGHAVTAIVLNLKIVTVTIERGEDSQGVCKVYGVMGYHFTNLRERKSIARDCILNSYAGFEAEKMFNPEADPGFSADDFEDAEETSKAFAILPRKCFVGDEKHLAYLERFKIGARKLLRKCWPSVKAVAEALMEGKTLTHEEVEQIIRETQPDLLEAWPPLSQLIRAHLPDRRGEFLVDPRVLAHYNHCHRRNTAMKNRTTLLPLLVACLMLVACDTKTKTVDSCGDGFLDPGEECDGSQMTASTCMELGYYDQQGLLTCKFDCTFDLAVCTGGRCGDGTIQGINLEQCDGENLVGATCANQGLGGGEITCNAYCRFDISRCELSAECGDDVAARPYEPCDGTDLDGQTCGTQGFYRGVLACDAECTGFDTSGCTNCGNGEVDDGEACDGANLNQKTCLGQGYSGGTLACTTGCAFDFSLCEAPVTCGNGQLDTDEQCDGTLLNSATCVTQGFVTGTLSCNPNCSFSTSGCTNCGNGAVDGGEACDGTNLNAQTCVTQGWYGGTLLCAADCRTFNDSSCVTAGQCGDGTIQGIYGEDCDGSALGGGTCETEGFYEGTLTCGGDCRYVTSGCSLRCGDGTIQTAYGEQCDGANLNAQTCITRGYGQASGALSCTTGCSFNESACVAKSTNADLASLTVNAGTLSPAYSPSTTSYSVTVTMDVTTLTVTATKANTYASVNIAPVQPMTLSQGDNLATVTVTAESGAQKVYTVMITQTATLDYESANIGTLIYVPGGTFQRDATPTNLSVVSAFRMSGHEITRAQWTSVTGWADPSNVAYSNGITDPVQMVNWYHAIAFCNKLSLQEGLTPVYAVSGVDFSALTYAQIPTSNNTTWNAATANWAADGYRLPTEMEWMWAVMGADTGSPGVTNTTGYAKAFAGSTGSNAIGDYAWYDAISASKTHPAGTKLPNELGLYDLSGNVWEWAWDWYAASYPTGTLTNTRGPASGTYRVSRGGSWNNIASNCAVAYQNYFSQYLRFYSVGFRVVRN